MAEQRFGPSTYGEHIASMYDALHVHMDPAAAVETLAELAGAGRALELGVGTGRIALPLAARGVEVHGIDASEAMVERLRAKPGGAAIEVTIGDFADVAVEGEFDLVVAAFNMFFALLTQDDQVRCFANVAEHLAPGGAFVVEAFVPDLARYERGQRHLSPNPPTVWVARAVERETVVLGGAGAVGGAGRVRRLLSGRADRRRRR